MCYRWKKSVLKLTLQIKEFIMNAIPSYTVVRSNPPSPTPKINENQTTQLEIRGLQQHKEASNPWESTGMDENRLTGKMQSNVRLHNKRQLQSYEGVFEKL